MNAHGGEESTADSTGQDNKTPSPPRISPVSSPGTSIFAADNILFDYSNCSDGYVSVNYTGTTRLKLMLTLGERTYSHDIFPAKGVQYITLSQGSGTYTVEIYELLDSGKYIKSIKEDFTAHISDEINMFTYAGYYVDFNNSSECVAKASEVCAGCTSALDKTAAVFRFVTGNIAYDSEKAASLPEGYIPDPDTVLAEKKGVCFDYASLAAAMLRSQGIPTRVVTGFDSSGTSHAWNEVYSPGTGWIAFEVKLDGTGFCRIDATIYAGGTEKSGSGEIPGEIGETGGYTEINVY